MCWLLDTIVHGQRILVNITTITDIETIPDFGTFHELL